ncbi:MAG: hypothetical protein ACOC5F_02905 [Candidatus Aminicenantaceae bacterium]
MLKNRIEKIENELRIQKINKDNVECIYKFFKTGNERLIPLDTAVKEVSLAANRTKDKDLNDFPGLLKVFNIFKKKKLVKNKSELFTFLDTKNEPLPVIIFLPDVRERASYLLLVKLGIYKIIFYIPADQYIKLYKNKQNNTNLNKK